jgi:hypothetical protein
MIESSRLPDDNLEFYAESEIETNKRWIDGKIIYRQVWTGTTGAGATSTLALGVTIDMLCSGSMFFVDSSSFGWVDTGNNSGNGPGYYFTNTTQNNITLYHNAAHMQSRPYRLILEYTK